MANRNFMSNKLYQLEAYPVLISCNFVVDSTNGNGLGIRSLKGAGVKAVYMHTSATPAAGNPNPAPGTILVQLQDNYNRVLGSFNSIVSPVSGTPLTATTANTTYVIVSLGTATLAQWRAKGLPVGITPAVGVAFIATATGTIGGSAAVETVVSSGISALEGVGDSNLMNALNPAAPATQGMNLIVNCLAATSSSVTTLIPTAPVNGTVIALSFYLSNSSVQVQGQ